MELQPVAVISESFDTVGKFTDIAHDLAPVASSQSGPDIKEVRQEQQWTGREEVVILAMVS